MIAVISEYANWDVVEHILKATTLVLVGLLLMLNMVAATIFFSQQPDLSAEGLRGLDTLYQVAALSVPALWAWAILELGRACEASCTMGRVERGIIGWWSG